MEVFPNDDKPYFIDVRDLNFSMHRYIPFLTLILQGLPVGPQTQ